MGYDQLFAWMVNWWQKSYKQTHSLNIFVSQVKVYWLQALPSAQSAHKTTLCMLQDALFIIMFFPNAPSLTKGFISRQKKCGNGSILMELISLTMIFLTEPPI